MINTGVIGCGNISRFHFDGIESAGSKVLMVCDIDDDAMSAPARRFDCATTGNWKEVTRHPEIQAVHVTLFSKLHKKICLDALENGKAVICEKTLSENPTDSAEIVRAARGYGVPLYTSYMKRFIPAVSKALELLPDIGTVMKADFFTRQPWGNHWEGEASDEFFAIGADGISPVRRAYGGGILVCGGSHILDLVGCFFGRPEKVFASVHQPHYLDLDLQASALFQFRDFSVHFEALAHPYSTSGFLKDGWDEGFLIQGSRGSLKLLSSEWDNVDGKSSILVHYDESAASETSISFSKDSPFNLAIQQFHSWISQGKQGDQGPETGYDVDLLIDSITVSAETGKAISPNWAV